MLSEATFGAGAEQESVTILVRRKTDLAGFIIEWRPLPTSSDPDPAWNRYVELGPDNLLLEDGAQVRCLAIAPNHDPLPLREPGTVLAFAASDTSLEAVHFAGPGIEVRLLAKDGEAIVHQRRFLPDSAFTPVPMRALRKLDGTALLLFPDPPAALGATSHLRLRWTFTRALENEDLRYRQSGSETAETATLDLVLPS
jgi:hypothetical protein